VASQEINIRHYVLAVSSKFILSKKYDIYGTVRQKLLSFGHFLELTVSTILTY
jgi:hypothetical protein